MGFFDFIKKKKTEEGPELPQPQPQQAAPAATASQLFDDADRAPEQEPDMAYSPRQEAYAQPEDTPADGRTDTLAEESLQEAEGTPYIAPESEQEEREAPPQQEEAYEAAPDEIVETEDLEPLDEVLPPVEETLPDEPAADENALPETEELDEESPLAGEIEPEGLAEETLPEEAEEAPEAVLPREERVPEEDTLPPEPVEEIVEEIVEEPEPAASEEQYAAAETGEYESADAPKKKFAFFGGKKEPERFTAEPADNKKIKDLNRDLKDLKEERSAFASRFEKSYSEHNKQINTSFNSLRQEVRQDITGLGREVIASNTRANGKIEGQLKDQNDAIRGLDATVKEGFGVQSEQIEAEGNKTRSEVQVGFARNKVAMQDVSGTVSGMNIKLIETQEKLENKLEDTVAVVSDRLQENGEKADANKREIVTKLDENTDKILEKLVSAGDPDSADIGKMTPAEHYKNMRLSIVALLLSLFSALLLLSSSLQILKAMVSVSGAHPVIILDFMLVYAVAVAGLVVAFFQKKTFYGKGVRNLKEYFKTKNPAHSMSKLSMIVSTVTMLVNTVFLFAALIAFLIAMFAHGAAAAALVAVLL